MRLVRILAFSTQPHALEHPRPAWRNERPHSARMSSTVERAEAPLEDVHGYMAAPHGRRAHRAERGMAIVSDPAPVSRPAEASLSTKLARMIASTEGGAATAAETGSRRSP